VSLIQFFELRELFYLENIGMVVGF